MITALIGDNFYQRSVYLNQVKAKFVQQYGDFSVQQIDASESALNVIEEAICGLSLLADNQLVVINRFTDSKEFLEQIESILKRVPATTDVVLVSDAIDKRLSAYGVLKKMATMVDCAQQASLTRWVSEYVKASGGTISQSDAQYLVERAGANQSLLSNELDKLMLYNPAITRKNIELLTEAAPQSTIFQLLDAVFSGKKTDLLTLYREQRLQKVEPLAIVGMLSWQLHIFALIKAAEQARVRDIAKAAKLNPYVVSKSQGLIKNFSLGTIRQMINNLLALEIKLKSQSIDSDDALQLFLLCELG